jgi:hypothetical protein
VFADEGGDAIQCAPAASPAVASTPGPAAGRKDLSAEMSTASPVKAGMRETNRCQDYT